MSPRLENLADLLLGCISRLFTRVVSLFFFLFLFLYFLFIAVPRKVVLETIEEPSLDDETTIGASRDVADYDDLDGYDMDDIFRESAFSPKPGVVEKGLVVNLTQTTMSTPLAKDQTAGMFGMISKLKFAGLHSLLVRVNAFSFSIIYITSLLL